MFWPPTVLQTMRCFVTDDHHIGEEGIENDTTISVSIAADDAKVSLNFILLNDVSKSLTFLNSATLFGNEPVRGQRLDSVMTSNITRERARMAYHVDAGETGLVRFDYACCEAQPVIAVGRWIDKDRNVFHGHVAKPCPWSPIRRIRDGARACALIRTRA